MPSARLTAIYVHPLKSGRPVARTRVQFDEFGLAHDRAWMLVESSGRFVSGRRDPRLTQTSVWLEGDTLNCTHPAAESQLSVKLAKGAEPTQVEVWKDTLIALDAGEAAAQWFSAILGRDLRLVRRAPQRRRPVDPEFSSRPDADAGFTDGFPILAVNRASLRALNEALVRKGAPTIDMLRFRPNLVIDGEAPWAEDSWSALHIGDARLTVCKPCERCALPGVNPFTAAKSLEPFGTLRSLRTPPTFGVNLVHDDAGASLVLGDSVQISRKRAVT